jgi:REP element-mobilizing transposase RayT
MERRARVPHRARAQHLARHPMHVTARAVRGLPSFRTQRIVNLFFLQMRRLNDASFQIVHFSVQTNHVHLIVEAADRETIARKMAGFMISVAKRLNAEVLRRARGKVWGDRYYRRDITRAREMHSVLQYVFGNAKKHGLIPRDAAKLDPASSAWTFDGWDVKVPLPDPKLRWKPPEPRTALLKHDWVVHGLLPLGGSPRS